MTGDFGMVVEFRLKQIPLLIHSSADQLFNVQEVENKKRVGDGG